MSVVAVGVLVIEVARRAPCRGCRLTLTVPGPKRDPHPGTIAFINLKAFPKTLTSFPARLPSQMLAGQPAAAKIW